MVKTLTVSEIKSNPFIRLSGKGLRKYNFEVNDKIKVTYESNKIVIETINQEIGKQPPYRAVDNPPKTEFINSINKPTKIYEIYNPK